MKAIAVAIEHSLENLFDVLRLRVWIAGLRLVGHRAFSRTRTALPRRPPALTSTSQSRRQGRILESR
jgi:hypothetical protein